jgi:two-component system nitrate/nitrite sensor histidine kinase NarX
MKQAKDLDAYFQEILENIRETIKTDFVFLYLKEEVARRDTIRLYVGGKDILVTAEFEHLIENMMTNDQPILIGDMGNTDHDQKQIRSMVAAPISYNENTPVGMLIAGNQRSHSFKSQHLSMMQSFSNQIGMTIKSAEELSKIEFETIISERTRLAREIHDGLAQTLGFLKLQTAQMRQFLSEGNTDRLAESLSVSYKVLSDAYLDTRHTIDDLRSSLSDDGFIEWLRQAAVEFESACGIPIRLEVDCGLLEIKPEVEVQLVRIIQEILSNIRKHAYAEHVWILCKVDKGNIIIEVSDDGCGFSTNHVPGSTNYGLKGIRERADLIGAGLEITTGPQQGTTARITLSENLIDEIR